MNNRCQRICGNSEKNCFISNRNQLMCISDMILNKVAVTSMLLESVIQGNSESNGSKEAEVALKSLDELTGWIKFLQMAHDLRETIGIFNENRIAEKRKEMRYPLPEIYQKYIGLSIHVHGSVISVQLLNFSQSGMQFKSPEDLAVGSVIEGIFFTERHPIKKGVSFIAVVRHCSKLDEGFNVGVQITAVQDDSTLDFFMDVHDFIVMALSDKQ